MDDPKPGGCPQLSIDKIRRLGWRPTRTSAQALSEAMQAMRAELKAGHDHGMVAQPTSAQCTPAFTGLVGHLIRSKHRTCSGTVRHHPEGYQAREVSVLVIARSPLRISLGGGGTDLPSYYREFGGFLDCGGDRQGSLHHGPQDLCSGTGGAVFPDQARRVGDLSQVQHPIIRESLRRPARDQ